MSRQAYAVGTSAYDLERLGALPEIQAPEWYDERPRTITAPPTERTRERVDTRTRTRVARRQTVSLFGVLGCLVAGMLLLMIVLSHMQLAVLSSELGQLDREMSGLREEAIHLQAAHESAFSLAEVERFAREELGMVEAARGQIVFIGSSIGGDVAEVLHVENSAPSYSLLDHMAGLLGILQESWSSIFGS